MATLEHHAKTVRLLSSKGPLANKLLGHDTGIVAQPLCLKG